MLLDSVSLKNKILEVAERTNAVVLVSAYVTDGAIDWLRNIIPRDADVTVLCRARPMDFVAGASTFSALLKAIDHKWTVMINQELHAKIYLFDELHCFVGSSNLTSNGLILSVGGNIEANTYFNATHQSLEFIRHLIQVCRRIDDDEIKKMEQYLSEKNENQTTTKDIDTYWPDNILDEPYENIFSIDFPINAYGMNRAQDNRFSDIDILVREGEFDQAKSIFEKTRIYRWLLAKVKDRVTLYFGEVSKIIHNELCDDPLPYRKNIKIIQANLYEYIEYLSDEISITRPNYSQALIYTPTKNGSRLFS